VQTFTFPGFPGTKFQTGMLVFGMPVKGKTGHDLEIAFNDVIDDLVSEGITADELAAVKQRARANFIRGLQGNSGMAAQLAQYHKDYGDWRELFKEVERIESVTLEDVQRVAGEVFVESNRNVGIIETEDTES